MRIEAISDQEIRDAALRLPEQWLVEDVCDALDLSRRKEGTRTMHIVHDLVDEGLVRRRRDGFYEVAT